MEESQKWAAFFRAIGNQNRIKILQILDSNKNPMSVTEIANQLDISFKNTSRNLQILLTYSLVQYKGKEDRVYYTLNKKLPISVHKILHSSIFN